MILENPLARSHIKVLQRWSETVIKNDASLTMSGISSPLQEEVQQAFVPTDGIWQ